MKNVMRVAVMAGVLLAGTVSHADFIEDFDSYTAGPADQGGWKGWDNTEAAEGVISTDYSSSSPNSLEIFGAADAVHEFTGSTSGQWEFTVQQYIPSTSSGETFVMLMNDYVDGGPYDWATELRYDMTTTDTVYSRFGIEGASLPILRDQWVELKFVIDLTANTVSEYYDGDFLNTHAWSWGGWTGSGRESN